MVTFKFFIIFLTINSKVKGETLFDPAISQETANEEIEENINKAVKKLRETLQPQYKEIENLGAKWLKQEMTFLGNVATLEWRYAYQSYKQINFTEVLDLMETKKRVYTENRYWRTMSQNTSEIDMEEVIYPQIIQAKLILNNWTQKKLAIGADYKSADYLYFEFLNTGSGGKDSDTGVSARSYYKKKADLLEDLSAKIYKFEEEITEIYDLLVVTAGKFRGHKIKLTGPAKEGRLTIAEGLDVVDGILSSVLQTDPINPAEIASLRSNFAINVVKRAISDLKMACPVTGFDIDILCFHLMLVERLRRGLSTTSPYIMDNKPLISETQASIPNLAVQFSTMGAAAVGFDLGFSDESKYKMGLLDVKSFHKDLYCS